MVTIGSSKPTRFPKNEQKPSVGYTEEAIFSRKKDQKPSKKRKDETEE